MVNNFQKWFYDGMKLKTVNHYKYLDIFPTDLTFSYALKDMSDRARKGAAMYSPFKKNIYLGFFKVNNKV